MHTVERRKTSSWLDVSFTSVSLILIIPRGSLHQNGDVFIYFLSFCFYSFLRRASFLIQASVVKCVSSRGLMHRRLCMQTVAECCDFTARTASDYGPNAVILPLEEPFHGVQVHAAVKLAYDYVQVEVFLRIYLQIMGHTYILRIGLKWQFWPLRSHINQGLCRKKSFWYDTQMSEDLTDVFCPDCIKQSLGGLFIAVPSQGLSPFICLYLMTSCTWYKPSTVFPKIQHLLYFPVHVPLLLEP